MDTTVEQINPKGVTGAASGASYDFAMSQLDTALVSLHEAQMHSGADSYIYLADAIENSLKLKLNDGERGLLADVLAGLLRQAELDLRETLAVRLAPLGEVPERIAMMLAHDVISVARPVLEQSPVLTAEDLLYVIQSKGAEYWHAIARRRVLESRVINQLADKNDDATSAALLSNDSLTLPDTALKTFIKLAQLSEELGEPLLRRPEITSELAIELYWHVGQALREKILQSHKVNKKLLDGALQEALQDMSDTSRVGLADTGTPFKPTRLMQDIATQYAAADKISDLMLLQTLRRNQLRFFIALFAARTGLTHETVLPLLRQVGGQGLAVAARACAISKESFVSMFLLSRTLARGNDPVNAAELQKAIKYYDALTEEIAVRILKGTAING